jgi:hypothetical protein
LSQWVFILASVLTSAAVLRGAGGVFLGWDRMEWEEQASPTGHGEKEANEKANYLPLVMIVTLRKLHDMIPTSIIRVWFLGLFSWVLLGVGIYLSHQMIAARLELSF